MNQSKNLLTISIFSIVIVLPQKIATACGPWPAPPEEYRLSIFQPDIGDYNKEFTAYFFSMNRYFKSDDIDDFATDIEINQNYSEWQKELKTNFLKKDFYKAVEEYKYQVIADSANELRKSNTFIDALMSQKSKTYFSYFKFAKGSEAFNAFAASQDSWGLDTLAQALSATLVNKLQSLLIKTQNKFIRERSAYILCRLFFYAKNKDGLRKTYNSYLRTSASRSWIKASAKYYYIRLIYSDSLHVREYYQGLTDVIDHSKDKRMICVKLLNGQQMDQVLPYMQTAHQKAIAMAAYSIRYPAYSLDDIKRIYKLDSTNKFIPLLISREINKLEDWLFTPVLTDYQTSASKDAYEYDEKVGEIFKKQNLQNDIRYATKFRDFLRGIIKNDSSGDFSLTISLCHLNFLLKDYNAAQQCCAKVLDQAHKNSSAYLQAKINSVVLSLHQKQKFDTELKDNIFSLLTSLNKRNLRNKLEQINLKYYYHNYDIKDALLVYLGRMALKMGDVTNACLLLSGTYKPWGEYRTGDVKSAYFILNEYATEKDFDKLLSILKKKSKTEYENYFCRIRTYFTGNYSVNALDDYDEGKNDYYWNINKVLDLKGTFFVNNDNLEKEFDVFKQIPDSFWIESDNLYADYLTGDPFDLNIYDTHQYNDDSSYPDNPNKKQFIEKLIEYKNKLSKETNPESKSKLCYIIGNAYYSMSYYGKFWLMSKLWWGRYELEYLQQKTSLFDLNYYGTIRAKSYYQKAFDLTKNPEKAAFYCMYLSNCENNRLSFLSYLKYMKSNDDGYFRYTPDDFIFIDILKQRKGSEKFYSAFIKECPLYIDFKNRL